MLGREERKDPKGNEGRTVKSPPLSSGFFLHCVFRMDSFLLEMYSLLFKGYSCMLSGAARRWSWVGVTGFDCCCVGKFHEVGLRIILRFFFTCVVNF